MGDRRFCLLSVGSIPPTKVPGLTGEVAKFLSNTKTEKLTKRIAVTKKGNSSEVSQDEFPDLKGED